MLTEEIPLNFEFLLGVGEDFSGNDCDWLVRVRLSPGSTEKAVLDSSRVCADRRRKKYFIIRWR